MTLKKDIEITHCFPTSKRIRAEKQAFNGSGKSSKTGYHHTILTRENDKLMLYLHYHTP